MLMITLVRSSLFSESNLTVIKDSPLDVAIIFGMDMSAKIAEHCCSLMEKRGIFFVSLP